MAEYLPINKIVECVPSKDTLYHLFRGYMYILLLNIGKLQAIALLRVLTLEEHTD